MTLLKTVLQGLDEGRKGEQKPGYLGLRNWWEVRVEAMSVSQYRWSGGDRENQRDVDLRYTGGLFYFA